MPVPFMVGKRRKMKDDPLEKLIDQKRRVREAEQKAARIEGQRSQMRTQLEEFECETVEQAETLHAKLLRKADRAKQELAEGTAEFDEKWEGKL